MNWEEHAVGIIVLVLCIAWSVGCIVLDIHIQRGRRKRRTPRRDRP